METVKRQERILSMVRVLGLPIGMVVYLVIFPILGEIAAVAIGVISSVSFVAICDKAKNNIMFEHVSNGLKEVVKSIGKAECIFEIKRIRLGMIVRVYLVKAGVDAEIYAKAIISHINKSWYSKSVWATQVAPINGLEEVRETGSRLDGELIERLEYEKFMQAQNRQKQIAQQRNRMTGERRYYDGSIKNIDDSAKNEKNQDSKKDDM